MLAQAARGQGGGASRRAHAGVRRGSIEAGTFENNFFAKPAKGECDCLIRMARVALDTGDRVKREARGEGRDLTSLEEMLASLTAGAVRVYEDPADPVELAGLVPAWDEAEVGTGDP